MRSAIFCALLFASAAQASTTISDEIGVNSTQTTPQNPRSGSLSNLLGATFDLGESWTLNASGQITIEGETPPPPGAAALFRDRGGTVSDFSVGVDWEATESFTFGLAVDFSPQSTTATSAPLTLEGGTDARSLVRVTGTNAALELLAGYDTAGDSNLEWSFTAGLNLGRYQTEQSIVLAQYTTVTGPKTLTAADVRILCARSASRCPVQLQQAFNGSTDELRSVRASLGVAATLFADTDLSLDADYYRYADDPTQAGYFSVGSAGRQTFGAGMAIAPLRYLIRPEIAHRFGDFQLKLWVQGGEYVKELGQWTTGGGIKAQYKFTKSFKMWATASGQRDRDSSGEISRSGTLSLGAGYRF